jgi:hypothetical protein
MLWGRQARSFHVFVGFIVPIPILTGLETANDRVAGRIRVRGRMLAERIIAAPYVAALRAPPQVEPPTPSFEALDATASAWRNLWINRTHVICTSATCPLPIR